MSTHIPAHFDGQHFVPDEPVIGLTPGDRVEVVPIIQLPAIAGDDVQWTEKLRQVIDIHPVVTHFVDDSRESVYAGRGE